MEKLDDLIIIEEEIEACYLKLAEIEASDNPNLEEYQYYLKLIINSIIKEKKILSNIVYEHKSIKLYELISNKLKNFKQNDITLGYHTMSIYFRIKNMLEALSGDDILEYAKIIESDSNKIKIKLLEELIRDPDYSEIKDDLILCKYNLVFLNHFTEDYFINEELFHNIELEANNYRTLEFLGYKYIDKAILIYDAKDAINYILGLEENFKDNKKELVTAVMKIIVILSNLTLCDEYTLKYINMSLSEIFENDEIPIETKELIEEMLKILKDLKDKISWAR